MMSKHQLFVELQVEIDILYLNYNQFFSICLDYIAPEVDIEFFIDYIHK